MPLKDGEVIKLKDELLKAGGIANVGKVQMGVIIRDLLGERGTEVMRRPYINKKKLWTNNPGNYLQLLAKKGEYDPSIGRRVYEELGYETLLPQEAKPPGTEAIPVRPPKSPSTLSVSPRGSQPPVRATWNENDPPILPPFQTNQPSIPESPVQNKSSAGKTGETTLLTSDGEERLLKQLLAEDEKRRKQKRERTTKWRKKKAAAAAEAVEAKCGIAVKHPLSTANVISPFRSPAQCTNLSTTPFHVATPSTSEHPDRTEQRVRILREAAELAERSAIRTIEQSQNAEKPLRDVVAQFVAVATSSTGSDREK